MVEEDQHKLPMLLELLPGTTVEENISQVSSKSIILYIQKI